MFKQLAKLLIDASRDEKASLFQAQRIRNASQRGNAARLLWTLPVGDDGIYRYIIVNVIFLL